MGIVEFAGYFGALIIGIVLGLIGGGGSILTVPVFVYLLHINPVTATAYSLFVVGSSSLVGAIGNLRKGLVDIRTAIVFSIPALLTVYLTRKYLVPAIPDQLFQIETVVFTKDLSIMIFFAVIMLAASLSMIKKKKEVLKKDIIVTHNYMFIIVEGILVGVLTGLVGAGGGFLIIPALVLFAKLPIKNAVATSLLIIAAKSLFGFIGDVENMEIDWGFLLLFTGISIIGIFTGMYVSNFIKGKKLEQGFGWFVLIMAIYIIIKELI